MELVRTFAQIRSVSWQMLSCYCQSVLSRLVFLKSCHNYEFFKTDTISSTFFQ